MVFTGIIQQVGRAVFDPQTNKLHVKSATADFWHACATGDSIAINGCCLTILAETRTDTATFFVMEESRAKTNLAGLALVKNEAEVPSALSQASSSTPVNMERALRIGDPLGGHTVTGHVDGVVPIVGTHPHDDGSLSVWIELPPNALVVHKGSITLDGTSLTVAELKSGKLRVSLIPHTLQNTTLHLSAPGRLLNVEFDQGLKLLAQSQASSQEALVEVVKLEPYARKQLDEARMRRAIELGRLGQETAAPNPWVGAVITDPCGRIIGEGYHQKAGQGHAEVRAIQQVKEKYGEDFEKHLQGATIYSTLEPCSHTGRTGPCDQLLIKHKFARVIVGLVDPDTKVSGRGMNNLRAAGMQVETGVLVDECAECLKSYLKHRQTGNPWVVLKIASSLDAKIAAADGSSQWISNAQSRSDVHLRWRATSQAILVGSKTAKADNPTLNVREYESHVPKDMIQAPLRVVVGKHVELGLNLLDTKIAPTVVYTSTQPAAEAEWTKHGVQVVKVGVVKSSDGEEHVDFGAVLADLGQRGVLQVLVEGGAHLASSLLQSGHVDQLVVYQAPILLGAKGVAWSRSAPAASLSAAQEHPLHLLRTSSFGSDVCLEYVKTTQYYKSPVQS